MAHRRSRSRPRRSPKPRSQRIATTKPSRSAPSSPTKLQLSGIVAGILVTVGGAVTTFRSRNNDHFLMDIETAAPWAGAVTLIGAVILLISCWRAPSHYLGGPVIPIVVGVPVIAAIVLVLVRTNWTDVQPETLAGLVALTLAVALLAATGARAWLRGRPRS